MNDPSPSDGNGGISGGAEPELRRSPEPIEWKPDSVSGWTYWRTLRAFLANVEPEDLDNGRSLRAAYRAGMLRAAEIAEGWAFGLQAAKAIRDEAAGGTPPDTERQ